MKILTSTRFILLYFIIIYIIIYIYIYIYIYIHTYIYIYIYMSGSDDGHWPKLVSTDNKQKAHKNQNDAYFLKELLLPS